MIPLFKRYSTYANLISMVIAAGLSAIGSMGLEADTVANVMLGGNVIIAICQFIKQKGVQ